MSLTDDRRWSQMHEFHFARMLRARVILGKQVMSRTCVVRYSALSSNTESHSHRENTINSNTQNFNS